jgi:nucleotide-binding universal stress UspA family protein
VNADQGDGGPRIVVGVDGSPSSKAALRWAICQAQLTGTVVEAVTAWWYPSGYGLAGDATDDTADSADDAEKTLAVALAEVSGLDPAVVVRPRIIQGHPAEVLVREAAGADLLVVGSSGHGGLLAMVLGSVSQHCAQRAPCPVLVMREPAPRHTA